MRIRWKFVSCSLSLILAAMLFSSSDSKLVAAHEEPVPTVYAGFQNDTGEDIAFHIGSRRSGFSSPPYFLKKGEVKSILFYDDHKDRALVAFDIRGDKVLSQFAFEPAFLLFSIQKNWKKEEGKEKIETAPKLSSVPH